MLDFTFYGLQDSGDIRLEIVEAIGKRWHLIKIRFSNRRSNQNKKQLKVEIQEPRDRVPSLKEIVNCISSVAEKHGLEIIKD